MKSSFPLNSRPTINRLVYLITLSMILLTLALIPFLDLPSNETNILVLLCLMGALYAFLLVHLSRKIGWHRLALLSTPVSVLFISLAHAVVYRTFPQFWLFYVIVPLATIMTGTDGAAYLGSALTAVAYLAITVFGGHQPGSSAAVVLTVEDGLAVAMLIAIGIVCGRYAALLQQTAQLYEDVRRQANELEQHVAERTAELEAANKRLQELDRLKSQFISNVSHELRTPLTNIKLYLTLLKAGRPEKREAYLDTLQREADRLQRLIEDVLDLSRLDREEAQPNLEPMDVNQLVNILVQDWDAILRRRGLVLVRTLTPDLPPIQASPRMLIQVLTNLIANAVNYTPSGGTVRLGTAQQQREDRWWITVTVQDTGPGIPPEERIHLFDRFYRGQAGLTSQSPGTGLGLAICQDIMRLHHGKLTVDSQVGQGSIFTIWLPEMP